MDVEEPGADVEVSLLADGRVEARGVDPPWLSPVGDCDFAVKLLLPAPIELAE